MASVGCEPRVDYSACSDAYHQVCPVFYAVALVAQLLVLVFSLQSLCRESLNVCRRVVAPHRPPSLQRKVVVAMFHLSKDTVLQMKLGTLTFSLAAVLHHAALLQPTPALPMLLVEYAYNTYNIFLVATIATTLRYWQEFVKKAGNRYGADSLEFGVLDASLMQLFTWRGCCCFILFTTTFCLVTDTWGLLSTWPSAWQLAAKMQHYQFAGVCFLIAISFLRIGRVQEQHIHGLLQSNYDVLRGDVSLLRTMGRYSLLVRFSYAMNALVWIACFVFCGLGGVFFDEFYQLALWLLLFGVFNGVGCFFAVVCFLLSSASAREAELRLHDLLSYCRAACRRSLSFVKRVQEGTEAMSRVDSRRAEAKRVIHDALDELFGAHDYPCYVMALRNLQRYDRLPTHEEALHDGTLTVLTRSSYWPCRSYCFFISQVWLSRGHPDGDAGAGNLKLRWMQTVAPKLLGCESTTDDVFLWMDIFSVPQESKGYQIRALRSLPSYAFLTGDFIPLVKQPGSIEAYRRRGWCQAECVCALTPKLTQFGNWRTGPFPTSRQFHFFDPCGEEEEEEGHLFSFDTLKDPSDPLECDFTVESDREAVMGILATFAQVMEAYEQSGSRAWDHTLTIEDRPGWLRSPTAGPAATPAAARPADLAAVAAAAAAARAGAPADASAAGAEEAGPGRAEEGAPSEGDGGWSGGRGGGGGGRVFARASL